MSQDILDAVPPRHPAVTEKTVPTPVRLPVSLLAELDGIAAELNYKRADLIRSFLAFSARQYREASKKAKHKK